MANNNDNNNIHPKTAICSGNIGGEDKPRVLLTNPEDGTGVVFSTDQTAKGRPEWIFPKCTAEQHLMLSCSAIITDYDKNNKPPPADLETIQFDPFQDGHQQTMVVRSIRNGTENNNAALKREFERLYFHARCDHGIIVVLPLSQAALPVLEMMPRDELRTMLNGMIQSLLDKESRAVEAMAAAMNVMRR